MGLAASNKDKGWEPFTDAVVAEVNRRHTPAVFMLWGSHAQKKAAKVDTGRHLVLKAPHPSPLSAHNGFFGCRHFSKANDFLKARSEEHTSELQSLMRISYAVFCLKKKKNTRK